MTPANMRDARPGLSAAAVFLAIIAFAPTALLTRSQIIFGARQSD
jgi:hypothetical protein